MAKCDEHRRYMDAVLEATNNKKESLGLFEKIAAVFDEFDRLTGVYKEYKGKVKMPEEICFEHGLSNLQEKRASFIKVGGRDLDLAHLSQKRASDFILLGDDFIKEIGDKNNNIDIEKAAAILPTLPADDAKLFWRAYKGM
jgi:hypothetical protein